MKRKAMCQKMALKTHTSYKRVLKEVFPYYQYMIRKNKELSIKMQDYFDLEKEEVEWLVK